jgi:Leucine-rich repeat (LRR) protein
MKKYVCLLLLLINVTTNSFASRERDSLALVAFYNSTGGANWTNKTNWLSTQPISKWYGITIDNNRVSQISLSSNKLSGFIPPEIGALTDLTILRLGDNQLSGTIPGEIGNLTNLVVLILDRNQLTGSIPAEIGNLTNLWHLSLGNNKLTGSIPNEIGNLKLLEGLLLYGNKLSGCIPVQICNLPVLSDLTLSANQLSGFIPPEIGNLTNLTGLNLDNNQLTGSIPQQIGNLTNLTCLHLSNNQLTGSIPPEIGNLIGLRDIDLRNNNLSGSIPAQICNLTGLNYLYLCNNQLSGPIPTEIGNLKKLMYLNLSNNKLTGSIPTEIGNLKILEELVLNNNQLTGSIPASIGKLTSSYLIMLNNNQLTGSIPPEIGNLIWLEKLVLNNNQLAGSLPPQIGNMTDLRSLYLNNNQLTGAVPGGINNIIMLGILKLCNNRFEILPAITLGGLDSLLVENNRLTFEDIEPNLNVPRKFFRYSPQDSIGVKEDILSCLHSSSSLSVSTGGSKNKYQWYKNNTIIPSAISDTYQILNLQNTHAGSYTCAITSTLVPALTLYSRPKIIKFHPSPLSFTIIGKSLVSEYEIATYSAPYNTGVTYHWSSTFGNLLSFPLDNTVTIQWGGIGRGYVIGYSKNQFDCVSDTSKLEVSIGTTGIIDGNGNHKIKMYPNPTTDYITINIGDGEIIQNYTLRVLNLSGKLVYETTINQQLFEFNLSNKVGKGIYFIEIKDKAGKTIVVQKTILQ